MMLRKVLLSGFALLLSVSGVYAESNMMHKHGDAMHSEAKVDAPDISEFQSCKHCGMDRGKFSHSRMYVEYDDGSKSGVCSLHCLAVDFANNLDKTPKSTMVGDYNSKKLIDAEKAYWVIGGKVQGVMSLKGKWAFEHKNDAETFMRMNGGKLVKFEDSIKAAYEDMYKDTRMIREKRKMKRSKGDHSGH